MILFKYPEKQREFQYCDIRLQRIVFYIESLVRSLSSEPIVITSIVRDDGSTHSNPAPYRFIDLAMMVRIDNEWLRVHLNEAFPYGKDGFETVPPLRHGTAPHFHIQVKP